MTTRGSKVRTFVEDAGDDFTELLGKLVAAESPSTDPGAQEPMFAILGDVLEDVDYRVRRIPGERTGGQLCARPRESRGSTSQLVLGHVDTVWPKGTLEAMPLTVEDGMLRGPGCFDMKGGLAQLVIALRALRALDMSPEVEPVLFLNSDEEIGSPESEDRIRRLASDASRCLVLEPALGRTGKIKTARRGTGHFEVVVRGKSAHAGLAPEEGASAILELSHVIQKLHGLTDRERGIEVNVGQVRGGVRPNVVAAEAAASVDVRVRTEEDARWLERAVRKIEAETAGTSVHIEGAVDRLPMEATPRNRGLWRATVGAGREVGLELEEGMSGGASDGNFTSEYTATIDGLGPVGDGAHAVHEFVDIERTLERAALLAVLMMFPEKL